MKDWKEYNDAQKHLKDLYSKAGLPYEGNGKYGEDKRRRTEQFIKWASVIALSFLLGIVLVGIASAAELVDMRIIQHIESRGNARAISPAGAVGLYQIMPVALKDYNQFHKVKYNRRDLYNPEINTKIARWLLTVRIPQLLAYYHRPVTTKNCIIAYNAGIRAVVRGYTPRETRQYIIKYNRLKEASRG